MHPIQKYCKNNGKTLKEFSRLIKISAPYVTQIISGLRRPSPDLALKIEKATGGMVKKEDLLWPDKGAA